MSNNLLVTNANIDQIVSECFYMSDRAFDRGKELLDSWKIEFLESIQRQANSGTRLSNPQIAKTQEIYNKACQSPAWGY